MTLEPEAVAAKSALRERLLARRRQRPVAERSRGRRRRRRPALLRGLAGARTFAAYVPDEDEPGHGRLPAAFTQLGARVLLPVVPADGPASWRWAVDTGRLAPGRFGLLEPVGPAAGTDRDRRRRTSSSSRRWRWPATGSASVAAAATTTGRCSTCAPTPSSWRCVFDDELVDELPAEPHDRRVTAVVTPSGGWQALPAGT